MIRVKDLKFRLHILTGGPTLRFPALSRETIDGNLCIQFSGVFGNDSRGHRLEAYASVGNELVGTLIEFPIIRDYDGCIGECDEIVSVQLQPAHLEEIVSELNAKATAERQAEIRAEYRPVSDGGQTRHCVIVQYSELATAYVECGVMVDLYIYQCGGRGDEVLTCANIVTIMTTMPSVGVADEFAEAVRSLNEGLQSKIDNRQRLCSA